MNQPAVTIHPNFKIHPGQFAAAQALLPRFVAQTTSEPGCRYYDFTINDDLVACREGYADAEATLTHLANIGDLLGEMMKISDLAPLEIHGPAAELAKLKGPLADYQPAWLEYACGIGR